MALFSWYSKSNALDLADTHNSSTNSASSTMWPIAKVRPKRIFIQKEIKRKPSPVLEINKA